MVIFILITAALTEDFMIVKSMTGYGKGVYEDEQIKLVVELKVVNHRFLDLNVKLPRQFSFAEDALRKIIKTGIVRGHVDVYVNFEDNREIKNQLDCDYALASQYYELAKNIGAQLGIENNTGVYELLRLPDVVSLKVNDIEEEELLKALTSACEAAIANLDKMRVKEGEAMKEDVLSKVSNVEDIVAKIEKLAPAMTSVHREKVKERVAEYLKDVAIDEEKFLNEMAFYADKVAVDEEITRLKSHIVHFRDIVAKGGAIGKQLDFVVQEMNRESNTTGSKCCDIEVSNLVVALKSEIEKIREQIQNIE